MRYASAEDYIVNGPATALMKRAGFAAGIVGVSTAVPSAGAPAAQGGLAAPAAPVLTAAQVDQVITTVVQRASTEIQLPPPAVELGPDPGANEWQMFAVGQPVWLWVGDEATIDASRTEQGIPLTLVARRTGVTIDTGDGATVTCTSSTPRPPDADPMAASPDCGHVWLTHGSYTVTTTADWQLEWSALGRSGTVPAQRSASRTVTVGELASVVVR